MSDCETVNIPCATEIYQSDMSSQAKMKSANQSIQDFSKINETAYIRL